jgi:hypothetical protein
MKMKINRTISIDINIDWQDLIILLSLIANNAFIRIIYLQESIAMRNLFKNLFLFFLI